MTFQHRRLSWHIYNVCIGDPTVCTNYIWSCAWDWVSKINQEASKFSVTHLNQHFRPDSGMYVHVPYTGSLVRQDTSQGNTCPSAQPFSCAFMHIHTWLHNVDESLHCCCNYGTHCCSTAAYSVHWKTEIFIYSHISVVGWTRGASGKSKVETPPRL